MTSPAPNAKPSILPIIAIAAAIALAAAFTASNAHAASIIFNGSSGASWTIDASWTAGTTPWNGVTASPADDLSTTASINMIIDSTEVYGVGHPNAGQPVQFRRVLLTGSGNLTIVDGGTLNFGGNVGSRIQLSTNFDTVIMTGGTLTTDQSNLGGVLLTGNGAILEVGGDAVVDISDPSLSPGNSPGILFNGGTNATFAKTFRIVGSNATIDMEQITIGNANNVDFDFVFDTGGASSVNLTNLFELPASTQDVDLIIDEAGMTLPLASILLFDLDAGSTGTFDQITTNDGTFSGADGTTITLGGEEYIIDYAFGDGDDIGLTQLSTIPEPASMALLAIGMGLMLGRRKR